MTHILPRSSLSLCHCNNLQTEQTENKIMRVAKMFRVIVCGDGYTALYILFSLHSSYIFATLDVSYFPDLCAPTPEILREHSLHSELSRIIPTFRATQQPSNKPV